MDAKIKQPLKPRFCSTFLLWNWDLQLLYSVYQFISSENDLNSNTEWSQRYNLYQTVIMKVSNNKPFVKSNLLRYKLHNTISFPKQFIRNNVRQHMSLLMSCFQKKKFAADAATKKPCSAQSFNTALRAVLINELIRINSGKDSEKLFYLLFIRQLATQFSYSVLQCVAVRCSILPAIAIIQILKI